jgi:hypothetical protein
VRPPRCDRVAAISVFTGQLGCKNIALMGPLQIGALEKLMEPRLGAGIGDLQCQKVRQQVPQLLIDETEPAMITFFNPDVQSDHSDPHRVAPQDVSELARIQSSGHSTTAKSASCFSETAAHSGRMASMAGRRCWCFPRPIGPLTHPAR